MTKWSPMIPTWTVNAGHGFRSADPVQGAGGVDPQLVLLRPGEEALLEEDLAQRGTASEAPNFPMARTASRRTLWSGCDAAWIRALTASRSPTSPRMMHKFRTKYHFGCVIRSRIAGTAAGPSVVASLSSARRFAASGSLSSRSRYDCAAVSPNRPRMLRSDSAVPGSPDRAKSMI